MRKSGDVVGLLTVLSGSKKKKSQQALDSLRRLDDAALPALVAEMTGADAERAVGAAFGVAAMVQRGNQSARDAACAFVARPTHAGCAAILLGDLAKIADEQVAAAVLAFLATPACPLCRPRRPDEIHVMPNQMTGNQLLSFMMTPDEQQETLVPAFKVLAEYPLADAEPYLVRALIWRDPGIDEFSEEMMARGLLSVELSRLSNAQMRVRCAAAEALAKYGGSESAKSALRECLDDEDSRVGEAARKALSSLR